MNMFKEKRRVSRLQIFYRKYTMKELEEISFLTNLFSGISTINNQLPVPGSFRGTR
jgi:hypothetical protein